MNFRSFLLNQNAKTCVTHVQMLNVSSVDLVLDVMERNVIVVNKVMS